MSQQGRRQASIRAVTGRAESYEGDWHALFDQDGIAVGPFNGRLLAWINLKLSTAFTSLPAAQQALAEYAGAKDWNGLGTFDATTTPAAPVNLVAPAVSGTTTQGQTLSVTNGSWSGAPTSYTYQWKRSGSNIGSATASTYLLAALDVGELITCVVTATNAIGSTPATSNAVGPIAAAASAPVNTVAPVVSGTLTVGDTLTTTNGTWTGSPSFTYQWKADGVSIGGATANTFVLTTAQIDAMITCVVTGTNGTGATPATSNSVGPVVPVFLPTLTTGGASYHAVYSNERLISGFSGALARAVSGTTDLGSGQSGITAANVSALVGAGVDARMDRYYDQSGNSRTATQATSAQRPCLNSNGVFNSVLPLLIDGGRQFNNTGPSFPVGLAFTHSLTGQAVTIFLVLDPNTSVQSQLYLEYQTSGTPDRDVYAQAGLTPPFTPVDSGNIQYTGDAYAKVASSPRVMVIREGASATDIYFDGTAVSGPAQSAVSLTTGTLGYSPNAGWEGFCEDGRLLAAVFCAGTLNSTDINAVTASLNTRFGIPTTYASLTTIAGDSIAEGGSADNGFGPQWYFRQLLDAPSEIYNLGIAGKSQAQCYADRAAYEGQLYTAGKPNIAIIQAGTNDINAGTLAADLYADITIPYVAYLRALGYIVFTCTLLPQTAVPGAGIRTQAVAYNALVLANTAGADGVIDFAGNAVMGPYPTAPNDTTLYVDGIHPTSLGFFYLGPDYAGAVNAAISPAGIPANTTAPTVSGAATVGSVISGSLGTWTNYPYGYARRWTRDGSVIGGETGATYTAAIADLGAVIREEVAATNSLGTSSYVASSNSIGPIAPLANVTWDTATAAFSTFSNGDKTATSTINYVSPNLSKGRTTGYASSGQKVQWQTLCGSTNANTGIVRSTYPGDEEYLQEIYGTAIAPNGAVSVGPGPTWNGLVPWVANDVQTYCLDCTDIDNPLLWVAINGGDWWGDAMNDPGTGVGGLNIALTSDGIALYPGWHATTIGAQATIIPASADFGGGKALVSGFTALQP